jgi:hypothetical protein
MQSISFTEPVFLRMPAGLRDAIQEAARRECMSQSEFIRRAAFEKVKAAGVQLPGAVEHRR